MRGRSVAKTAGFQSQKSEGNRKDRVWPVIECVSAFDEWSQLCHGAALMVIRVGNTIYNVRVEPFLIAAGVLFLLIGARSIVYTVDAEYEGVITRFGRYHKTVSPGLGFKLPFGIDFIAKVPVKRQQKAEFGFGTSGASNRNQYSSGKVEQEREKNMVTGDLNAATVEWVVQYRITEPKDYLFNVLDPEDTLRDSSESVMREVVGDRTVDEVITIGRQDIEREAQLKLEGLIKKYALGLTIDQVQLKDVNPPVRVQPSFNEVNNAQQEREQSINVASGEYNKTVPRARGEAEGKVSSAEGYAIKRVNEAEGDATRFNAMFTEYQKAPEVTRRRIYLETMRDVLPQVGRKIIMDDTGKNMLPLLQLNSAGGQQ
jgi:modulator of FtsH protease HflK